jgi:hypothetical protein
MHGKACVKAVLLSCCYTAHNEKRLPQKRHNIQPQASDERITRCRYRMRRDSVLIDDALATFTVQLQ